MVLIALLIIRIIIQLLNYSINLFIINIINIINNEKK